MNIEHSDHEPGKPDIPSENRAASAPADNGDAGREPVSPVADESPRKRRGGGFFAFLAMVFSVAALAIAAWMWWQDQQTIDTREERLLNEISRLDSGDGELRLRIKEVRDQLDALASGDVSAEFRAMQQRMESDREQLANLEQSIREQLALSRSLQAATDSMHNRLQAAEAAVTGMATRELDGGGELDLAEVDYLLRLANERLKLFADPAAAADALEVADLHLAALDNPIYLGVRQEIAAAQQALATLELPDYLQLANRLDTLQGAVAELTFKGDQSPVTAVPDSAAETWWGKTKSVFASLVTVRRAAEAEGRLSIEDKDYVRQRLWLQIEIAHLALMRRDEPAFRTALGRVEESLSAWFVADDDAYRAFAAEIDALTGVNVEPDVPDITAPWSTLRLLRDSRPGALSPAGPGAAATPAAETTEDQRTEAADDGDGQG